MRPSRNPIASALSPLSPGAPAPASGWAGSVIRRAPSRPLRMPPCGDRPGPVVVAGHINAMLWNGRDQHAAVEQVQVQILLELAVGGRAPTRRRCAAARGRSGTRRARPRLTMLQGTEWRSSASSTPGDEALAQPRHVRERSVGEHLAERRAGGGQRQRVAGQRAADAAGVLVVGSSSAAMRSASSAVTP